MQENKVYNFQNNIPREAETSAAKLVERLVDFSPEIILLSPFKVFTSELEAGETGVFSPRDTDNLSTFEVKTAELELPKLPNDCNLTELVLSKLRSFMFFRLLRS